MKKTFYFLLTKSIGCYINLLSYVFPKKAIELAHGYFSEPRTGKLSLEKLPKCLNEAHFETINYNEDKIQTYIWKGNKTIVFLIHGWESNSSRWKKILPYLKKLGYTIVAIDGPGQGLSSGKEFTIPKYAEFITEVGKKYQPNIMIGHSMGGKTCLYYQFKFQNPSLEKIISLGAPSDFNVIFNNFINLLSLNSIVKTAMIAKYTAILNRNLNEFSAATFVQNINVNGLLVHDIEDQIVLFEEAKKIKKHWKNAQFIETQGLGHKLHDADLYQKIYSFLMGS